MSKLNTSYIRVVSVKVKKKKTAKQRWEIVSGNGDDTLDTVSKKSSWRRKYVSKDLMEMKE